MRGPRGTEQRNAEATPLGLLPLFADTEAPFVSGSAVGQ